MKNVHVLSTDKLIKSAGDLVKDKYGSIHIFTKNDGKEYGKTTTKLNIYITSSDEGIKDWFIYKTENKAVILKAKNINSDTITVDSHIEVGTWVSLKYCKKIILTTDDRLVKDGVQPIDDEFLEWFVKNPSCEFVEVEELTVKIDLLEYKTMYIPKVELKHPKVFSENGNELFFDEQGNLIREEPKMKLINKDVHEHYCSLELLQLLYDKGMRYREWTEGAFTHNSLAEHRFNQGDVSHLKDTVTHQIVVEWLRVNHGIWIYTDFLGSWKYVIVKLKDNSRRTIEGFNSPKEATEAGILYVLNNLI
jgi:hypothetical protein